MLKTVTATTTAAQIADGSYTDVSVVEIHVDGTPSVYVSHTEAGCDADATRLTLATGDRSTFTVGPDEELWVKAASTTSVITVAGYVRS